MIGREQLNELAQSFSIDTFSVFREYLQLLFLGYFYREKASARVFFKGGTALRLIFGSPRFSEDLDFSTTLKPPSLEDLLRGVVANLRRELPALTSSLLYAGKNSRRYRLIYRGGEFKYPLPLRLDFNLEKNFSPVQPSSLTSTYPLTVFPVVLSLSAEEILAEKVRAFFCRGRGRDIFDLWFLLEKGIPLKPSLLAKKFSFLGETFSRAKLRRRLESFSGKELAQDLHPFLPAGYRPLIKTLIPAVVGKVFP